MKFIFKPFTLDTNAYSGQVLCDDSVGKDTLAYQVSLKRAFNCLTKPGHHTFEEVFNKLTRDKTLEIVKGTHPTFSFSFKNTEVSQTLFEFLTEEK